jgi:hypothetical protein
MDYVVYSWRGPGLPEVPHLVTRDKKRALRFAKSLLAAGYASARVEPVRRLTAAAGSRA